MWAPCLTAVEGRWVTSADAPEGQAFGTGETPVDALMEAPQPLEGAIDELLACLPP